MKRCLGEFSIDPAAFVTFAFPWGKPNTPLAKFKGPKAWQLEELEKLGLHIRENVRRMQRGEKPKVYHFAMASGRGVGKSAFVAMIVIWFMSCVLGGTGVITANTDAQLSDKTFGEIKKWLALSVTGYWFDPIQKKIKPHEWLAKSMKDYVMMDASKYYAAGILWDAEAPDAFAGEHSQNGMLLIFDEASGIPPQIWDVSEGFFTDETVHRYWFVFSNPRRNSGAFFECFHKLREFWNSRMLDARTVEGVDKDVYERIIAKHGPDSDQAKVEVYGQFPTIGERQFISREDVNEARDRELDGYDAHAALVMGVDPARYGGDSTVIRFRRGRDARSIAPKVMNGADNMRVAEVVAEFIDKYAPDGVFIDSGAGAGIIDRLKQMGYKVFEVQFGGKASDETWFDHRTEMWARMREWLKGGMIDDNDKLRDDLCGPEYDFSGREERIKLESKDKMKDRGLASPDHADALALTFHCKIAATDSKLRRRTSRKAKGVDYKIFG